MPAFCKPTGQSCSFSAFGNLIKVQTTLRALFFFQDSEPRLLQNMRSKGSTATTQFRLTPWHTHFLSFWFHIYELMVMISTS